MRDYKDKIFRANIKKAADENKLIIFVGAGISRLCGLPSWDEAANDLLNLCVKQPNCEFTFYDMNRVISNIKDAREKITIGYYLLRKIDDSNMKFQKWLVKIFTLKNKKNNKRLFRIKNALRKLTNVIISTNVDLLLDDDFSQEKIYYKREELNRIKSKLQLNDCQLWHIHGSIKCPSETVFTTKDYLERYTNEKFRDGLHNILSNGQYTILFIGYGCSELQLLDFLVNSETDKDQERLYLLQPYFKSDECIYNAEEPYYRDYGIQLIQYPINNGYDFLIGVLEELEKDINSASTHQTQIYANVEKIIGGQFNSYAKKQLATKIIRLDDYSASTLIYSMRKNINAAKWLRFLALDSNTRYLFDVNQDITNDTGDEPFNFKNIRFLLNEYVDNNSVILDKIAFSITNDLINKFKTKEELFKNYPLVLTTLKVIFFNHQIANSRVGMKFVAATTKKATNHYCWLSVASADLSKLEILNKKTILYFLDLAISNCLKMNGSDEFRFEEFSQKYFVSFVSKYPKEIYKICYTNLTKVINKSRYSDYNLSGDCFEIISKNNDSGYYMFNSQKKIIKWMLEALDKIEDNEWIINEFNKNVKSDNKFEKRLSIYISNKKILFMKERFIKNINKFANIDCYSEIYSLLKSNKMAFTNVELNKVLKFIADSTFSKSHQLTNLKCKMDLCDIFIEENSELKQKFLDLKNELSTGLSVLELKSMEEFPSPYDRSKIIIIGELMSGYDTEIKQKLLNSEVNQLIDIMTSFKKFELNEEANIIYDNYDEFYERFKFKTSISFEKLLSFSEEFMDKFIYQYFKDHSTNCSQAIKLLENILSLTKDNLSKKQLLIKWCQEFFSLLNREKVTQDEKDEIFEKIYPCICDFSDCDWQVKDDLLNEKTAQNIFSSKVFFPMNLLISIASNSNWNKVKMILEQAYSNDKRKLVAKCIIVYKAGAIFSSLDNDWFAEIMENLFDNHFNDYNYSFAMFSFSRYYSVEFVKKLINLNIFNRLINSKEFNENSSRYYVSWVLFDYVKGDLEDSVLDFALDFKSIKYSALYLLENIDDSLIEKNSSQFTKLIKGICNKVKEKCENLFLILIEKITKVSTIKEECFQSVIELAKNGFKGIYIEDLFKVINGSKLDNNEIISIIQAVSEKITDFYFYKDEIISLFKQANWGNKKEELNDLVAHYRKEDPELASRILGIFELMEVK